VLRVLLAVGALVVLGLSSFGLGSAGSRSTAPAAAPNPTSPLPTPAANEVSLELTDTALTDQLNTQLVGQPLGDTPLGPASLRHVSVEFRNGQVLTSGEALAGSTSVPLSISSTIDLQAGRPVVRVHDATASGVPLPASARAAVQQAMQAQLEATLARRPMRVRSLTVTAGKLLVIGEPSS
jgi:hypothetical protein